MSGAAQAIFAKRCGAFKTDNTLFCQEKPFGYKKDYVNLYPNEYTNKCTLLKKQLNLINGLEN